MKININTFLLSLLSLSCALQSAKELRRSGMTEQGRILIVDVNAGEFDQSVEDTWTNKYRNTGRLLVSAVVIDTRTELRLHTVIVTYANTQARSR